METLNNIAYIDGQNLHLGTKEQGWSVDHARFMIYLKQKYLIKTAYYFIGYFIENEKLLYSRLRRAGFVLIFREHSPELRSSKKGNVDSDIVFYVMKEVVESSFEKAFIVSGDGDYKKLVVYLIERNSFGKILFPSIRYASSLYKELGSEFYDYLENVKDKIVYEK